MSIVSAPARPTKLPPQPGRATPRRRRRRRGALIGAAVVVVALAGGWLALRLAWPEARLSADSRALARIQVAPFGETVARVRAVDAAGRPVSVAIHGLQLWPSRRLGQGERVTLLATVRRTGPLGWLIGRDAHVRATLSTPTARIAERWLEVPRGRRLAIPFKEPASVVRFTGPTGAATAAGDAARASFVVPAAATAGRATGTLRVRAAARRWEWLSAPVTVTWFPAAALPQVLVRPAATARLTPLQPITLTFSRPLRTALGDAMPKLLPPTPGRWRRLDSHTLVFSPSGTGFPFDAHVRVVLPDAVDLPFGTRTHEARTLDWRVPPASTLRLQQVLAQLHYLPLGWAPNGADVASTPRAQLTAAVSPPAGRFSWRYGNVPSELAALWQPGRWTVLTQGAVMAFQSTHHLAVDGIAGAQVWGALLADLRRDVVSQAGYSYVLVHRSVPQSLLLWHDGADILTTPVNTGVPAAPTALGTDPVYLRYSVQEMSGVNPDGSHYADPGIQWISYFHGGEAVHGFNRGSYGTPQSVGCVELPIPTAARVWPYTPIGTLVTIVP